MASPALNGNRRRTGPKVERAALLDEARCGSAEAVGKLFESVRGYLLLAARRQVPTRLRGRVGASDLVQDALAAGHQHFQAFRGGSPAEFFRWMRTILASTAVDHIRWHDAAKRRPVGGMLPLSNVGSSDGALIDGSDRPDAAAIRTEDAGVVEAALETLPADQRRVLWMRHWEGRPFDEIATTLDRSPMAVRKLWCRGLARLEDEIRCRARRADALDPPD